MNAVIRLVVAAVIVVLLVRAARIAWHNRRLAVTVWRSVRPRHVLGSVALLAGVLAVMVGLLIAVPVTGVGLGTLVGLTSNAVFAPVEVAGSAAGGGAASDRLLTAAVVLFLSLLLALLPWLAYVEERTFREGLEDASLGRQATRALRFGLVHLVMLVPLAAALAIGVAGFVYGRIYRAAYRRAARPRPAPLAAEPLLVAPPPAVARRQAVLASTVWHATFNSLIVLLLLVAVVTGTTGF